MDLEAYWQQNKRFLVTVGAGLIVYLIGVLIVNGMYSDDIRAARTEGTRHRNLLASPLYTGQDRDSARRENEALEAAVADLSAAVAFEPRPGFVLEGSGRPEIQYFAQLDAVRESLGTAASRNRLSLPDGLGIEMIPTNSRETIERRLEALDLIDRAVHLALDAGVTRIKTIRVSLDPALNSRSSVGAVERTKVVFTMTSSAESVVAMLLASQTDRFGQPLVIEDFEIKSARDKRGEVQAEVSFLAVRLHEVEAEEVEG